MNKKNILLIASGIISVAVVILEYVGTYRVCDFFFVNGHQSNCPFMSSDIEAIFLPLIPLFIFSIITYKMRDEIFQAWFRFVRIYIPVVILLIVLAPSYTHNWMFPYDKSLAAFLYSAIFIIASIILIASEKWKSRKVL